MLLVTSGEWAGDEEGHAAVERFRAAVPQAEVVTSRSRANTSLADASEQTIRAVGEFLTRPRGHVQGTVLGVSLGRADGRFSLPYGVVRRVWPCPGTVPGTWALGRAEDGLATLDVVEDRVEQLLRMKDVLAGEHASPHSAPGGDRLPDRAVLAIVPAVELVGLGSRHPRDLADERPRELFASCSRYGVSAAA